MQFPNHELKAISGHIYGFIFENSNVDLKRNLFISINIEFDTIKYDDEEWECSLTSEWIPFVGNHWKDIENIDCESDIFKEMNETSFYMVEHDWCNNLDLQVNYIKNNIFRVKVKTDVNFSGYADGDENPAMPIEMDLELPFTEITIIGSNLEPELKDIDEAVKVVNEFIDTCSLSATSAIDDTFKFTPIY